MISFPLAREIYGVTPWMVDHYTLPALSAMLENFQKGVKLEEAEIKLNTPFIYDPSNETRIITRPFGNGWTLGELENSDDFDGVAVINLDGPITVSGGMSTVGMEQISVFMHKINSDKRIKAFIILANSGGGSASAVDIMVDTINEVKQNKPVYGLVKKGGMAASACYGILSACTKIFSENEMNIVGSVGTMIQFEGRKANTEDPNGVKHIRLYATKSTAKNKAFEEALNNDNYTLLINDLLDPLNERFIQKTLANRPLLKGVDFDNGSTKFSKDAIGTYIDGIKSFAETVELIMQEVPEKKTDPKTVNTGGDTGGNSNINNKNKKMTVAELKTGHPEVYNTIFNEGVMSERDRNGAWMAHVNADPDAVVKGIESGESITQTQREEFFVKQNSINKAEALKQGSAKDVVVDPSKNPGQEDKSPEELELEQAFDFKLK